MIASPKLSIERLSDRLAALLIGQIEQGQWVSGQRLPTEAQMAANHGVSRSVVREAVHQVKSRGLLVSRQGSGVFVAPPALHLNLVFDAGVLESTEELLHVVELRSALEGEIAALAAQRSKRSQITELRRKLAAIDAAALQGHDGVAEDMAFHRYMAHITGNPQFPRLMAFLEQYLLDTMRVTKRNEARSEHFMQQVRDEHRALIEAIAAHNPAAAREAAVSHIERGRARLSEAGLLTQTPPRRVPARASRPARASAAKTATAKRLSKVAAGAVPRKTTARPG